ncbi:MAG: copper homeostasis protein CutC [Pirellulaceae bacterium]
MTPTPSPTRNALLEVCVDTVAAAVAACQAGADRIELSQGLELGGLTPSIHLTMETRRAIDRPLVVLVRCRGGGFQYDEVSLRVMRDDCRRLIDLGIDGLVVGALDRSGSSLDWRWMESLPELAPPPFLWVVHRAFDAVAKPLEEAQRLANCGYQRILTSGGPPTAYEGIEPLRLLQYHCGHQIEVLPAGGIRAFNAVELIQAIGCRQLHGSFRSATDPHQVDGDEIQKARQAIDSLT